MRRDPDYIALINTWKWQKTRRAQLNREPLCELCAARGVVTPATQVHHKRPISTGRGVIAKTVLAYDPANLQSLCEDCHRAVHDHWHTAARMTRVENKEKNDKETAAAIDMLYNSED